MLSFHKYITELFDKPAPITWSVPSGVRNRRGQSIEGTFAIGDIEYFIDFEPDGNRLYQMVFGIEDASIQRKYGHGTDPYAVNAFGVLGTGKSYDVFSTVIEGLQQFIHNHAPWCIYFSAHEPSRKKLYDRFIKLVGSRISGYTGSICTDQKARKDYGIEQGETLYMIEKKTK